MSNNDKKKIVFYIDGFNLYYGIKNTFKGKYKWLDIVALAKSFLKDNMKLERVKYFTSIVKGDKEATDRQKKIYLQALEKNTQLSIYYGKFSKKKKVCSKCGYHMSSYEEKRTDVNIACEILKDFYERQTDYFYLMTGDSDLISPVKIIKDKNDFIKVIFPPKRVSKEMNQILKKECFYINEARLKKYQLPNEITFTNGKTIFKPSEWK